MKRVVLVAVVLVMVACAGCSTLDVGMSLLKSVPLVGDTVSNAEQAKALTRIADASERQADALEAQVYLSRCIMEVEAARVTFVVDEPVE